MNSFPKWKTITISILLGIGFITALPNIFGSDPAIQVTREDGIEVLASTIEEIESLVSSAGILVNSVDLIGNAAIIRFQDNEAQLTASAMLREELDIHVVALTLAPRAPSWFQSIGLRPMSLGLDLRGGVYFLYQVDLDTAINQYLESFQGTILQAFRSESLQASVLRNNS